MVPDDVHERIAFIFGATEEVERIDKYHTEDLDSDLDIPLYNSRGLFRTSG